jgi:hypothetical protein
MAARTPARHIAAKAHIIVMRARRGGEVDFFPLVIREGRTGPAGIIAGVEFPGTVQRQLRRAQPQGHGIHLRAHWLRRRGLTGKGALILR